MTVTTETYGCPVHGEDDAYQGCALCELEALRSATPPSATTVTIRYDLSPAQIEGAIRDRLIALGWTPPPADQPKDVVCNCDDHDARYCVNRIGRRNPCRCACHGASVTAAHSGADTTTATPPTLPTSTDKSTVRAE